MSIKENEMIKSCEYRLSELNAKDEYDYKKISNVGKRFLPCEYKIESEKAVVVYDIEGKRDFSQIMKESRLMKLKALIDVGNFKKYQEQYIFSIKPDNLYYDMYGKVYVMFRDIRSLENTDDEEHYLTEYKALIGCTLSNRYSFENYFQGGMNLLKRDKFLVKVAELEEWGDIVSLLQQEADRVITYNKEKKIEVSRSDYRLKKVMAGLCFVLIVAFLVCSSYYFLWLRPYNKGVIQAQNAYLDMDYIEVIDNLDKIDTSRLDRYQKYILATSYVKCENLTEEQKSNILASVEINGNEKILDYWISIGRLDVENAENIAQQISDEQLLIYAYLKERYILEADTEISGDEKAAQLKNLDDKIQSLTEEENTEE